MPVFTSIGQFQEHKHYIPALKKALLTVKPETQKKILYVRQFPFGQKKLQHVVVDFDAQLPGALAKAGHEPTDVGLVSLTAQDELNFEGKKGNLKRIRLKKYFATMGGGIKSVYVPPGETDDEGESEGVATETTEGAPAGKGAPGSGSDDGLRQLLARIKELESMTFPDKIAALKTQVLQKAQALGQMSKFAEANMLLDQLAAKAGTAPSAGSGDNFKQRWMAARKSWQTASEALDAQVGQLQAALRKSGDNELVEIAEFGLNGVTGNFKTRLMAAMLEVDQAANAEALKKAAGSARGIIGGFRQHIDSDERVQVCDDNPFGVTVSIRKTLGEALGRLEEPLATVPA